MSLFWARLREIFVYRLKVRESTDRPDRKVGPITILAGIASVLALQTGGDKEQRFCKVCRRCVHSIGWIPPTCMSWTSKKDPFVPAEVLSDKSFTSSSCPPAQCLHRHGFPLALLHASQRHAHAPSRSVHIPSLVPQNFLFPIGHSLWLTLNLIRVHYVPICPLVHRHVGVEYRRPMVSMEVSAKQWDDDWDLAS